MEPDGQAGWSRRQIFGGIAFAALAFGIPFAAVTLTDIPRDTEVTDRQRALMKEVSQLVIPRTQTPGAGDVGAGDFVILALAHGLEKSREPAGGIVTSGWQHFIRADGTIDHIGWLEHELDESAKGDFLRSPVAQRQTALSALDAAAYAKDGPHPWRTLKALILTGYYTSEAGGSQELRYEPVPGRWDPDLPLTPDFRAISNDWTAVDFG